MIILRNKLFATNMSSIIKPPKGNSVSLKNSIGGKIPSSKDLQIEQMKLQRQVMVTQRQKQALQAQEKLARDKQLVQLQKSNQKENIQNQKQMIEAKKLGDENRLNPADRNWGLIKSSSKITPPVSMK